MMRPDAHAAMEVLWEGPGRYAWRMGTDGVQRWHRVGTIDTPLSQTLAIVAQRGLMRLTWADAPEDLDTGAVVDLTHTDGSLYGHDN